MQVLAFFLVQQRVYHFVYLGFIFDQIAVMHYRLEGLRVELEVGSASMILSILFFMTRTDVALGI